MAWALLGPGRDRCFEDTGNLYISPPCIEEGGEGGGGEGVGWGCRVISLYFSFPTSYFLCFVQQQQNTTILARAVTINSEIMSSLPIKRYFISDLFIHVHKFQKFIFKQIVVSFWINLRTEVHIFALQTMEEIVSYKQFFKLDKRSSELIIKERFKGTDRVCKVVKLSMLYVLNDTIYQITNQRKV